MAGHAWFSLFAAGLAFCGSHILLSSTRLRGSLRDQLGESGYLGVYSLTALATILLVAGYSTPNPPAVGMERRADADDPAPGMLRVTRHPVMWAIGLWGLSHLVANEDLASLWFFGAIAALALGGTVLIDRKKSLALGSNWQRLASVTSNVPFAALAARRSQLRLRDIGLLRPIAALLLYAVLYLAHPLFAGVPIVLPWATGER